jgi:solute carrier family 25 protein 42
MFKSFLAGGAAGATAKTIVAPLDRIKIIFQISEQSFTFRGVYRELLRTFHTEGFTALFRGNGAQILRVYPYSGIQLTAFDSYSKFLLYEKQALLVHEDGIPTTNPKKNKNNPHVTSSTVQLTPFERMLAGSAAGATSVAATYPLDLMRARLAVQRATVTGNIKYEGLYPSFLLMRKEYGWKSFYRGMAPTLLGILPYAGISFATYGTLKQMSRERAKNQHHSSSSSSSSIEPSIEPSFEPSTLERLLYGGIAGLAGQSSTYPLDIVRRRMQTEGFTPFHAHVTSATRTVSGTVSSSSSSTVTTKDTSQRNPVSSNGQRIFGVLRRSEGGMVDTLQRIYYREGKRGLFKGLSMNVIKGPIAVGVSFTTYDFLKRLLDIPEGAGMGSSG